MRAVVTNVVLFVVAVGASAFLWLLALQRGPSNDHLGGRL